MLNSENHKKLEQFKAICLKNAGDFVQTAEGLIGKNVNHIAFHLAVLCMEEVGKTYLVWFQLMSDERGSDEEINLATDDHIKKLFWAVWGNSLGKEKITQEQIDERKNIANNIHNRRLFSLYTEITDTTASAEKISNEETENIVKFSRTILELSKLTKHENNTSKEDIDVINWWIKSNEDTEMRKMIWGSKSQEKLIEIGNVRNWIKWLKEVFDKNDAEVKEVIKKELQRTQPEGKEKEKPKWRIKFKLITPSHSIKNKELNAFNTKTKSDFIKLAKGSDNHTLIVQMVFPKNLRATLIWDRGWMYSKLLAVSLNVATRGIFWWNTPVDTARFYDEIWDLENNMAFFADVHPRLQINWKDLRWKLEESHLGFSATVFAYLVEIIDSKEFEPIKDYMNGMATLAKNDVHLRLEANSLLSFYYCLRKALLLNQDWDPTTQDIKDTLYEIIKDGLAHRNEIDRVMDIAIEFDKKKESYGKPITLTDVVSIKNSCDLYLIKRAYKHIHKAEDVRLVTEKEES